MPPSLPLIMGGTYGGGQLYKNTVTDEDGNKTIEFKNGQGQTLVVRKIISASENADTYYVYNEYNQLAWVIPPLLAKKQTWGWDDQQALAYEYRYDGRGRLVEKKLPGKGWEYMVYDKQDRLILTRDSNLEAKGQWLFTKYDQFSRPIYTGILESPPGRIQQVNAIEGHGSNNEIRSTASWNNNGMDVYYTNGSAYPTMNFKLLSINYYDTYPSYSFNPPFPSTIQGEPVLTPTPTADGRSTKGLPVMSLVKNIEDDNWTKNYTYYDTKGRAIGSHSINYLGGYTKTESKLDFAGVPQKTYTTHLRRPNENGVMVKERFVYDNQNRLLQHYHQVDSQPEELLVQNEYNELSQLKNKKVGNNLQSIDYDYNIRGWMTHINKDQMAIPNLGGKLFSYKIKYTQKEGIENPDPAQFGGKNVKARYNGNIAEVDWRAVETLGVNPSSTPKRYGYAYDNLNRLTAGYYQNPNNPYSKENTESLAYDLNGNITNLYRTSVIGGNTTATVIDNLQYTYQGNRLTQLDDASGNPSGYEATSSFSSAINYDANGNMTNMPGKGIMGIQYNHLNLPQIIEMSNGGAYTTDYIYSADGTKVKKTTVGTVSGPQTSTTTTEKTDYLDGFQYLHKESVSSGGGGNPGEIFPMAPPERAMEMEAYSVQPENTATISLKTQDLQFFPTAEGFYDYTKDQYIYSYKDHLGNARVSFGRTSAGALEIVDSNDYYPFGMNHLKTGNAYFGAGSYKTYKYNGKELQETGMYDYGARFYMPDIGRWGVVDMLAETSRRWSAYAYAYNNPIRFIDPDGMQNKDITFGKGISAETQNKIVSDLEKETGLALSVGSDGKLSYKETENMGGSETARGMLKGAIDNHRTDYEVNSDNTRGSSIKEIQGRGETIDGVAGYTHVYDLNINTDQIDSFIAGASKALNPMTMGYGITTLHEVSHMYNDLEDQSVIYGIPGPNEKVINTIRTELDATGSFKLPFGQRKSYSPLDVGGINFSPFSSEAYKKGPSKVDSKKDLYIKTPRK
jgi:RHS repeat-associated protein